MTKTPILSNLQITIEVYLRNLYPHGIVSPMSNSKFELVLGTDRFYITAVINKDSSKTWVMPEDYSPRPNEFVLLAKETDQYLAIYLLKESALLRTYRKKGKLIVDITKQIY